MMKKCLCFLAILVLACGLRAAALAANSQALKGLKLQELGLRRYNTRTQEFTRTDDEVSLSDLAFGEHYTPWLRQRNDRNYDVHVTVRIDVTGDDSYSVEWPETVVPSKGYWFFYMTEEVGRGALTCRWYIDDVFLAERTFTVSE